MKKFIALALLTTSFNAVAELKEKNHKVHCTDTNTVIKFLTGPDIDEYPALVGDIDGGRLIVWHNKDKKAMTITWTDPSGKETCLVIEGVNVKTVDKKDSKRI